MPEGHTLHRLARDQQRLFGGQVLHTTSPQGRFAVGAAIIDGRELVRAEAYGKHLLHRYSADSDNSGDSDARGDRPILHVHLGLYGKFTTARLVDGAAPEPRGALRLRLMNAEVYSDLRGPTACEMYSAEQVEDLLARLGPDPIRARSDPGRAYARLARSRVPIAALVMDQTVLAGVGNVYRAEILYRHRVDPFRPGRDVAESLWLAMWADLVTLMRAGVRSGRIVTVRDADRPRRGRLTRDEAVYVYRRTGLPCRVCGTEIRTEVLAGRNLFWCPLCQAPGNS